MSDEKAPTLTLEAKAAIRGYILHLFAVPAVVFSGSAFVLGYLIKDVAAEKAYNSALKDFTSEVVRLTNQAGEAVSDANFAKKQAEDQLNQLFELRRKLETAAAVIDKSDDVVAKVSESLSGRKDFIEGIARAARVSKYERFVWEQGKKENKMMSESDGFCFLTYVRGKFEGDGESVEVSLDNGNWVLRGKSKQQGVKAEAMCAKWQAM